MTNSTENNCTCPSGDGSLSHPCPMHPASNENELKVGDPISRIYKTEHGVKYALSLVLAVEAGMGESAFIYTASDILAMSSEGISWQRGIHPSLIPEGFELVESAEFEACKECVGLSKQQNDLLKEQIGLLKQTHRLELEAAQKEIERLRKVLDVEAAYCQKYANLLKSTDLPRSLRHQERADRLRDAIKPEDKQS